MEDNEFTQAGGHPGSLIFEGDKLYKRCKQGEISFWEWLYQDHTDPQVLEFRQLAPGFHGTVTRDGNQFICIDNMVHGYRNASVMDCKLGRVTWTKDHSPAKVQSQSARAAITTTGSLGFRISGLVVRDSQGKKTEAWTKEGGFYSITAENIHEQFIKIVTQNGTVRLDIVDLLIQETHKILDWFSRQKIKTFVTSSIFYVVSDESPAHCQAKLIDFAHVSDSEGELDSNVIEGLTNVISIWERIKNLHKS